MPIYWAGYSMLQAELNLLRSAVAGRYHYYHLLSGVDLPLASQDAIHAFLEHSEAEYIDFAPEYKDFAHYKAAYRHVLVETTWYRKHRWVRGIRHAVAKLQQLAGLDRSRQAGEDFHHGSAFFSITHPFAEFALTQAPWIERTFRHGLACEEVVFQTLVMKSPFKDRLGDPALGMTGNLRYIDWRRREGNSPRTFRMSDWDELLAAGSKAFFARKFNRALDPELVDALVARFIPRGGPDPR
jgi:hypothetical protein